MAGVQAQERPEPSDTRPRDGRRPGALLLAAAWAGLLAGFVELAVVLARVQLVQNGLFRRNPHAIWMIPACDAAILGLAGLLAVALIRPIPRVGPFLAYFLISFLAFLAPLLAVPGLRFASCAILALGLASWAAPMLLAGRPRFRRLVGLSSPALVLILAALAGVSFGRDWLGGRGGAQSGVASPGAPSVLFIVMDTVRADATSLNGAARDTTPNLAALARRGARFERAIATAPYTLPSHASMFTGRWAQELGVGTDRPLDARFPTLAEYLGSRGYATAGFVGNTSFCTREFGIDRGFDHYEGYVFSPSDVLRSSALGTLINRRLSSILDRLCARLGREACHPLEGNQHRKDAAEVNASALTWIAQQGDRPFFAFLNYFDAHDPYLLPAGAPRRFGKSPQTLAEREIIRDWVSEIPRSRPPEEFHVARDAYDDCIAYLDGQIGRLLAELDRMGRLENTMIVVTADHGEHFGEHMRGGLPLVGHRLSVYQPEIHVPLLIVAPGRIPPETVVPEAASLRDLPATIVDLAGLRDGSPFPGRSLRATASSGDPEPQGGLGAALSELNPLVDLPASLQALASSPDQVQAVVSGDQSYHRHGDDREELYDLREDPGESSDLSGTEGARGPIERLRAALRAILPPE